MNGYSAYTVVNASIGAAVVDSFGHTSNNRQGIALRRHIPVPWWRGSLGQ